MALIRRTPRASQPQTATAPNLSCELLEGAKILALVNGSQFEPNVVINGSVSNQAQNAGLGVYSGLGAGDLSVNTESPGSGLLVDFWAGYFYDGAPSTSQYLFGDYTGSAGCGLASKHTVIGGNWGYFDGTSTLSSGEALVSGSYYSFVVTREVVGGQVSVYRDGVLKIVLSVTGPNQANVAWGSIGRNQFATFGTESVTLLAGRLGAKTWDARQAKSFSRNPWQIFAPAPRRNFGSAEAAGPITRPLADVMSTGWTPSTGIDLAAMIKEPARDDASYITSPVLDGSQGPYISTLTQALPAGNYDLRLAAGWVGAPAQMRVVLLDDANAVQGASAWTPVSPEALSAYTLSVTTTGVATRQRIEAQ